MLHVMTYDLLFGKGIQGGGAIKRLIIQHKVSRHVPQHNTSIAVITSLIGVSPKKNHTHTHTQAELQANLAKYKAKRGIASNLDLVPEAIRNLPVVRILVLFQYHNCARAMFTQPRSHSSLDTSE